MKVDVNLNVIVVDPYFSPLPGTFSLHNLLANTNLTQKFSQGMAIAEIPTGSTEYRETQSSNFDLHWVCA